MKYWQETLAVTQRILTELIRRRRSLIFWAIFPISILCTSFPRRDSSARIVESTAHLTCLDLSGFLGAVKEYYRCINTARVLEI